MRIPSLLLILLTAGCPESGGIARAAGAARFMIFPLENQTKAQSLAWVGEGVAIAISEAMLIPGVETISREERSRFVESVDLPPGTPLSRASMIRVAQRAAADRLVFGSYAETEAGLRISLRSLDLASLRLGREIAAAGPLEALPRLENDLAWAILGESLPEALPSRADFSGHTRAVPNGPYSAFIQSLAISNPAERLQALQKVLNQFRAFPQAAFVLGSHYFESGEWARAIPFLRSALKGDQAAAEAQFMLGTCHLMQSNLTGAIAAYEAFLTKHRALEAYNNLGVALLRKGEYSRAEQGLMQARKLATSDLTVELNLAILYHLRKNHAAALAVLDPLLQAYPEQGMLHYVHGLELEARGEFGKAEEAKARALQAGVEPETLKRQGPRFWTRVFPAWVRRPVPAWVGSSRPSMH